MGPCQGSDGSSILPTRTMKNIKKFLPSKMLTAFFVIPLMALILFFSLQEVSTPQKESSQKIEKKIAQSLAKNLQLDTDGDGVLDWEEKLHKTNPKNKDTDSDGLEDGFEIATGTDPLDFLNKKAQDRAYEKERQEEQKNKKLAENLNVTEKMAQELLNRTKQLYHSDLSFNTSAQGHAAEMILDKAQINFESKFTEKDLNISQTLSSEKFKENFLKMSQELQTKINALNLKSEIVLIMTFLETNDVVYLKELEKNLEVQKLLLKKNLELEIPVILAEVWLNYLNLLGIGIEIIKIFINSAEDPMSTLSAMTIYNEIQLEIKEQIEIISLYFFR